MKLVFIHIVLVLVCLTSSAQQSGDGDISKKNENKKAISVFQTNTPLHDYDLLLNNPTETSMNISVLFHKNAELYIEYNGLKSGIYTLAADVPQNIRLENLAVNQRTKYMLHYHLSELPAFVSSQEFAFQAKPASCDSFHFSIIADSHLDENCNTALYCKTLLQAASTSPAFHMDLGDTFMVDKYGDNYTKSHDQFLAQRYYFGLLCATTPVFLVLGNHDGENLESKNGMTEWSKNQRALFFPSSYQRNYYAFEWGNSLMIVLDPYGYSPRSGMQNPWDRTLGNEQYKWLKKILSESKAVHKFVFIHNLVGGIDINGKARGGAEVAGLYEWGGHSESGSFDFASKRPNWEMPIHELLKRYGVSIVFHGHDHLYAKQIYDGISYICVPQPGQDPQRAANRRTLEYGYKSGYIKNSSGFLNVNIKKDSVLVNYIESMDTSLVGHPSEL